MPGPFAHAVRTPVFGAIAVFGFVAVCVAAPGTPRQIEWADLDPASKTQLVDRSTPDPSLEGQRISLSGYLLPADREGELVYSFMLVSRPGACSHKKQPPPHQIVRVVPATPYRMRFNYEPVRVSGQLTTGLEKTQMFILDGPAIIQSGFGVHGADIRPLRNQPSTRSPFQNNPWQPLTQGENGASQPLPEAPASLSRTR